MFKSFLPDIWDYKIENEKEEDKDEEENRHSLSLHSSSQFDDRHQEQQDFDFNDDEFLVIHKLDNYSNEITFTTFDFHDLEKVVDREI